jgi:hypothetical protein
MLFLAPKKDHQADHYYLDIGNFNIETPRRRNRSITQKTGNGHRTDTTRNRRDRARLGSS